MLQVQSRLFLSHHLGLTSLVQYELSSRDTAAICFFFLLSCFSFFFVPSVLSILFSPLFSFFFPLTRQYPDVIPTDRVTPHLHIFVIGGPFSTFCQHQLSASLYLKILHYQELEGLLSEGPRWFGLFDVQDHPARSAIRLLPPYSKVFSRHTDTWCDWCRL